MNNTKDEIKEILEELKENGIENVLSLRGDYPKDSDGINHGDFKYASELNEFIEENFPNDFVYLVDVIQKHIMKLKTLKKIF